MKKLISLILCLALCLPVLALAEAEFETIPELETMPEFYTIDFGTFTMDLGANDYYEVAEEMASNSVYAIIYPNYDPTGTIFNNINIVWSSTDATAEIQSYGAETYASLVLQAAAPQFEAMGIKMSNSQVLSALFEENVFVTITHSQLDYTGAGIDLVTPQYQMQVYFCLGDAGTYVFTFTAVSLEQLEALSAYVDGIVFK